MQSRIPIVTVVFLMTFLISNAQEKALPSLKQFDSQKYMGLWYEVARLPTPVQPGKSLATAEYSFDKENSVVLLKNTAYESNGNVITTANGMAKIAEGDEKGRLRVGFGPSVPKNANYCILRLDKKYQISLVGSPDRKNLWVLSRKPNLPEKRLKRLLNVAKKAGFDTAKVIIADWPENFEIKLESKLPDYAGNWNLHIQGPNGEPVAIPLELTITDSKVTGKIQRGEGRWLDIKEGKASEEELSFVTVRDRPNGGEMKYSFTGKLVDGKLTGKVKANFDDSEELTMEWNATRP